MTKPRILPLVVLALSVALASGCAYRYRFNTGEPPSDVVVKEWRHIYVWGWVDAKPFDLEAACPGGTSQFGSYVGFLNWLPAFFSLGIYAPRTVFAVCSDTGVADADAEVAGAAAGGGDR